MIALSLRYLAIVALLMPPMDGRRRFAEHARAARLCGFIDTRLTMLGIPEEYGLPREYHCALAALRETIGTDEVTHLMAAGATMNEDEAIAHAHALE